MDRIRPQQTPGMIWAGKSTSLGHKPPVFCNRTASTLKAQKRALLAQAAEILFRLFLFRISHSKIKNSVTNRYFATRIPLGLLELRRPSCDNLVTIIDGNRPKSAVMDALSGG